MSEDQAWLLIAWVMFIASQRERNIFGLVVTISSLMIMSAAIYRVVTS